MRITLAAICTAAAAVVLVGCSSGGPGGPPVPSSSTAAAAAPACGTIFRLGAAVTAADATVACTNQLGFVSRSHSMACHDGRVMVFDRDANVYGFPGGRFGKSDTDADSQYAKDFAACAS